MYKYYTVYKITNKTSGKYYIGKHQTNDLNDEYMGSGTLIKEAIKLEGRNNFIKEILFVFDNPKEMDNKEHELVEITENTYNQIEGGSLSPFQTKQIAQIGRKNADKAIIKKYGMLPGQLPQARKKASEIFKKLHKEGKIKQFDWTGRKHKEETKRKIGEKNSLKYKGSGNPNYNKQWITNGLENRLISKNDSIPIGFIKGRRSIGSLGDHQPSKLIP